MTAAPPPDPAGRRLALPVLALGLLAACALYAGLAAALVLLLR